MQAVRSSVLAHIRLRLAPWMQAQQQQPLFSIGARLFAAEAQEGSYLDKVDVTSRVLNLVKKMPDVQQAMVSPYSNFQEDLDMDSLDTIEVVMAVEEEFGIEIPYGDADKILTIQDAIDYVTSQPQAK